MYEMQRNMYEFSIYFLLHELKKTFIIACFVIKKVLIQYCSKYCWQLSNISSYRFLFWKIANVYDSCQILIRALAIWCIWFDSCVFNSFIISWRLFLMIWKPFLAKKCNRGFDRNIQWCFLFYGFLEIQLCRSDQ